MTAEAAMAKAREICPHSECHYRVAWELLEAHKLGVLEGIDIVTEKAPARIAEAK